MKEFNKLIKIMKKLRNPTNGCPWDLIQTENTLKEFIIEEAYELIEAIEINSIEKQKEELGDLLLQIIFLSQINMEKNNFNIKDVVNKINKKLIGRHPHVFDDLKINSDKEVKFNWLQAKIKEKKSKSVLSDYPQKMPSLINSKRISEQASSVGFDWKNALSALKKVEEEIEELKREIKLEKKEQIYEEIGDILFAIANVSRLLDINPELALRDANKKFVKRFRFIEEKIKLKGKDINKISLKEMENLWKEAK